jgi:hypothetical protein
MAFEYLGNSLTHDPRNPKAILAAGSIIQNNQDMDVALIKYRVAAVQVRRLLHANGRGHSCASGLGSVTQTRPRLLTLL